MFMRYAAATLLLAVLTASAVRAQSPEQDGPGLERDPIYKQGGSVTYILPEAWEYPSLKGKGYVGHMGGGGLLQRTIYYPAGEGEESGEEGKVAAQIVLSTIVNEPNPISLKEWSDPRPPQPPDFVVLSDTFHGDNWRTLVSKGTLRGEPYVGLHRTGLVGKQLISLSVRLLTDGRDPEPLRQAVADFNALCENLKIDGKNPLDAKLNADKILELLAAGAKK